MIGAKVAVGVTTGKKELCCRLVMRRCESDALTPIRKYAQPWYLDPQRDWLSADFMRQMALLVIDKCIISQITGEIRDAGFSKTTQSCHLAQDRVWKRTS